jgi:hypothetical protein
MNQESPIAMNKAIAGLALFVLFAGCTRSGGEEPKRTTEDTTQESSDEASSASGQETVDLRSQFDLAAAIRVIERVGDDEARASALAALSESWQGARYRWTVTFLPAFCPNADGCHVVPFERGGKDNDIVQGWVPQLELSDSQWQRLAGACAPRETRCRVTFAGTLSEFRISTEELTRLTFSDVSLLAVADTAL